MCRLFGLSGAPRTVRATFWLVEAPDSLAVQSRREPDGTGLGVAQCRRLIERAQGQVHLQSEEGKGTTVTVRLPKADRPLRLRFELTGHQPLEREASLQSDQALELTLQPIVIKQKPRPVTDGVLDPF